jgi:hypothetical protein
MRVSLGIFRCSQISTGTSQAGSIGQLVEISISWLFCKMTLVTWEQIVR